MIRIALIVFAAVLALSPSSDLAKRGPPLVRYFIDIGTAKTLPRRDPDSRPSNEWVIVATPRILAESDDALVHMETLRRAYEVLGSEPSGGLHGPAPSKPAVIQFGQVLKDAVLIASVPDLTGNSHPRREVLAWFDLGYFLAIKENCLHGRELLGEVSCHGLLERAAAAAPQDAALQFGVAFAQRHNTLRGSDWSSRLPEDAFWQDRASRHLVAAMDLTKDPESLLAKNICALMANQGPFGPPTTFDAIRAAIGAESRPK